MGTSPRLPSLILEETELAAKPLRWQKGHVLGRGGFGCVYMGLNQENGELFAVKQLELDDVEDPKSRAVNIISFKFVMLLTKFHLGCGVVCQRN